MTSQLLYFSVFFNQGLLDSALNHRQAHERLIRARLQDRLQRRPREPTGFQKHMGLVGLGVVVGWVITMPLSREGQGSLTYYPIYSNFLESSLYTLGTCLWIYILVPVTEVWVGGSQPAKGSWSEQLLRSSYYLYLSHYCWLVVVMNLLPSKFLVESSYGAKVVVSLVVTLSVSFVTYLIVRPVLRALRIN